MKKDIKLNLIKGSEYKIKDAKGNDMEFGCYIPESIIETMKGNYETNKKTI